MTRTKKAKNTIFKQIIAELGNSGSEGGQRVRQGRTLCRYLQDGLTTAALCGAGSFYMLILMACSRIRPEIRLLDGPMAGRIAKLFRCPPGMIRSDVCSHTNLLTSLNR